MSTNNYLVTGGAGFIGSHIAHTLHEQGHAVRVLDNFSTGYRENLADIANEIEVIEGSLADMATVRQAVNGINYILHQAALPSVPRSIDDPLMSHTYNATGTLNLLVASRDAGVKRVVYASSSSVYGDSPTMPKVETMRLEPKSPYAVSKLAGEHYCKVFYQLYGLETICLRYFNVFGSRQDPNSPYSAVIPLFIISMLKGESPTVHGDGLQSRDFTYVANNVHANILATTSKHGAGQAFNLACGERYTLLQLIDAINDILGTNIVPVHVESRPGDIKHSQADITSTKEVLGYQNQVNFRTGLEKTVEWYAKQI
ncbi:MAG: LPS biosynthesis protein WbpP [Anaerolineaceae bacterium 4572_78]|nr:MAG: LPS biosynthesis protein WbpP [Anaerolineaceae bacterium 4572_78]